MPATHPLIAGWARSAVVPRGGAFAALEPHQLAAPVLQGLLQRAGVPGDAVDAVVLGNALGAGGNPARMVALAAGLPDRCAAFTVDTQCCAGLDAVAMAVGLIASGQAEVVVAGGVEAWSRSPLRARRPAHVEEAPQPYERPPFAPDPARDPDMLAAAQAYAQRAGWHRAAQEAYAIESHARALVQRDALRAEIVPVLGVDHDPYPRALTPARAARWPVLLKPGGAPVPVLDSVAAAAAPGDVSDHCELTALTVSAQADGAALVLLVHPAAAQRLGLTPRVRWVGSASVGRAPETPLLAAEQAAREVLRNAGLAGPEAVVVLELHDAFAVQGLDFAQRWGIPPDSLNRRGGGLARGHPIGASGAVALVRALADLARDGQTGDLALAAVAGAGGLGAATLVRLGRG